MAQERIVIGLTYKQVGHYGNYPVVMGIGEYVPNDILGGEMQEIEREHDLWPGTFHTLVLVDADCHMAREHKRLMSESELRERLAQTLDNWRNSSRPTLDILNEDGTVDRLAAYLGANRG